jgi:transcriptional antiterminator NusG
MDALSSEAMTETRAKDLGEWYVIQTLSNQEGKVKRYLDKFIVEEEMEDYVFEVLVPTENVVEVKNGSSLCMGSSRHE